MKTLLTLLLLAAPLAARAETIVFKNARIIDGVSKAPIEKGTMMVTDDRFIYVGPATKEKPPAGARVVDLKGRTVMPGMINAHGHVGLIANGKNSADAYTRENVQNQLLQYEKFGVTSMCSLGLNRDLVYDIREDQKQGKVPGATLYTAGRGIGVPDAAPPVPSQPDQVYRPTTVEEAKADVADLGSHHPDFVKVWVDDVYGKFPKMQPEVYGAVIKAAHNGGLHVAAHVFYLADAKRLAADGLDAFAHSIRDQPIDKELLNSMSNAGTFQVATFTVDESSFIFAEDPKIMDNAFFKAAVPPETLEMLHSDAYKQKVANDPNTPKNKAALAMGMKNLMILHDAGMPISFGTDSGAQPVRIPGWAEHHELELMVRAGLTPMEAITAATHGAASMLQIFPDKGSLAAGKKADFLVLADNPLKDIRNTRKMVSIWHNGKEVQPAVPYTGK
ncbi:MAG TPA: amidohydrolase family protein [Myxococcales bacterium]|jgi:imidazolonepropionase-like amidohydrolase|nr:amidohydrolase family protein [Myxococcales bacterium]